MSLLQFEKFTLLAKETEADGYGGETTVWTDNGQIDAVATFDTSIEALRAEAEGVRSRYTITTERDKILSFHQVLRRERDGKIFRVTSDGDDSYTPASAFLDMRQVTAEEFIHE